MAAQPLFSPFMFRQYPNYPALNNALHDVLNQKLKTFNRPLTVKRILDERFKSRVDREVAANFDVSKAIKEAEKGE